MYDSCSVFASAAVSPEVSLVSGTATGIALLVEITPSTAPLKTATTAATAINKILFFVFIFCSHF